MVRRVDSRVMQHTPQMEPSGPEDLQDAHLRWNWGITLDRYEKAAMMAVEIGL